MSQGHWLAEKGLAYTGLWVPSTSCFHTALQILIFHIHLEVQKVSSRYKCSVKSNAGKPQGGLWWSEDSISTECSSIRTSTQLFLTRRLVTSGAELATVLKNKLPGRLKHWKFLTLLSLPVWGDLTAHASEAGDQGWQLGYSTHLKEIPRTVRWGKSTQ